MSLVASKSTLINILHQTKHKPLLVTAYSKTQYTNCLCSCKIILFLGEDHWTVVAFVFDWCHTMKQWGKGCIYAQTIQNRKVTLCVNDYVLVSSRLS